MSKDARDRILRALMTDAQWKAFRMLAVERDQELRELTTAALQVSPLTKKVFSEALLKGAKP